MKTAKTSRRRAAITLATVTMAGVLPLMGAGAATAAPAAPTSLAVTETVSPATANAARQAAYDNLGLSTTQARYVQCWLMDSGAGYPGPLDGLLGTESWKAFQRYLAQDWQYPGPIDGDPGPNTKRALQRMLMEWFGYPGPIDGLWGPNSIAAFRRFAEAQAPWC